MDTLTHALSGALAGRLLVARDARAGSSALSPWQAMAAGAIAAAFPDVDFALGYVSELTYLRAHRGVTHSLLLWPAWGLLLAWLLAALARRCGWPGASWRAFYAIACAGLLIHIAGDVITQFGTMILAPLSDRRYGLGTTFIIDLVLSGILLAGLAAPVVEAAPRPASPFNWTVIVFDGARYHYAHVNTRRRAPLVATEADNFIRRFSAPYLPVSMARWEVRPRFGDDGAQALARAVWQAQDFAFYRWFAMFPVLDHVEPDGAAGGGCAGFRDLRFEMPGRAEQPFRYGLCGGKGAGGWRLYGMEATGRHWITGD